MPNCSSVGDEEELGGRVGRRSEWWKSCKLLIPKGQQAAREDGSRLDGLVRGRGSRGAPIALQREEVSRRHGKRWNRASSLLVTRRGTVDEQEMSEELKEAASAESGKPSQPEARSTDPFPNPLVNLKLYTRRLMTSNSLGSLFEQPS